MGSPWMLLVILGLHVLAFANPMKGSANAHVGNTIIARSKDVRSFEQTSQFDVFTILLILGEATIWKAIWSRYRFRRKHWTHGIFAISPGWTPLAASVFTAMEDARGPPNLIFDRAPPSSLQSDLCLTNLHSGSTHYARHVILQNIWQAWYRGPRTRFRSSDEALDVTRELGVVDVDLTFLNPPLSWKLWMHIFCLLAQVVVSLVLGFTGFLWETFATLVITLIAQWLLLWAVTPRQDAWNNRKFNVHRARPAMFHRGLDSMGVLIIRSATLDGQQINLEEYSWDSQALRNRLDFLKLAAAAAAFGLFVLQIILVGWMQTTSRITYFALGILGLVANAVDGSVQPDWSRIFNISFSGESRCEPKSSTLMAAVGILIAAGYPAAESAAKQLYPDNVRFAESRKQLSDIFNTTLCNTCRDKFLADSVTECSGGQQNLCVAKLADQVPLVEKKQIRDGVAAVSHYLRWIVGDKASTRIETRTKYQPYDWKLARPPGTTT